MKELFLSELRRFRRYALIAAVAHLLVLVFLNRMTDLLQQPYFDGWLIFALYLLLGLAFGLLQIGSYRKPSQWLWLIHRPLPPSRIFGALALSATLLIVSTVTLPQLLLLAGLDVFTTRIVDSRHYLTLLHVLAFVVMAWLAGAHAILSRHKAAVAVLALPIVLALHLVSVRWLLLPVALCLAWLVYITLHSFRANREAPPRSGAAVLLTAIPLQLGFFLLVFSVGQFLFVTGSILAGTDPLNTAFPPAGGLIEIQRKEPAAAIVLGLERSADPRAASWREQLPLLEPIELRAPLQRYPIRHQLSNLPLPNGWYDDERGIFWQFSHDRMLFLGRDPRSGVAHGAWGVGGAGDLQPFAQVPIPVDGGMLMLRDVLYALDHEQQRVHELLRLPSGEWFIELPRQAFDRLLVVTNQRLLAYRQHRGTPSKFAPRQLDFELALPAGAPHLTIIQVAELMDGWLVSFVYGDGHRQIGFSQHSVVAQPWQQVVFVDADGAASVVAERRIRRDYPALHMVPWWLSPPLYALSEWPQAALDKGLTWPLQPQYLPSQPAFWIAALLLMLGSVAGAWWWLRHARMTRARRALWLMSCAVVGLPAFLSLLCMEPRAAR